MLGTTLEGGGEGQNFVFGCAGDGADGNDLGFALGERAGFVEDEGVDAREALEAFAAFEKDAELGAAPDGDGEGGGNREAHGAGAGDDEHGDRDSEGAARAATGENPNEEGCEREDQHDGNEDGADVIGELLHGSARGLRLFDETHHLAENAVGSDGGGAVFERAVEIERASDDAVARFSRDGERFAGDQRFVDGGDACENDAIDGDALARAENHDVAGADLGEGNFDFGAIPQQACRLRLELHEFVQGIEGAALRARIEPSAEQQEAEDEEDRVVVDVSVEAVAPEDAGHGGGGE